MTDQEFLDLAKERYGSRGVKQAKAILLSIDGDDLHPDDRPFIREAMMDAFWDAKAYNQRYANRKYRKDSAADAEVIMEGAVALF